MKQRKIPMRTCVVTKEKCPKKDLIRVVRDNTGNVTVDVTGKANGRGAYIKNSIEALDIAKKTNVLERFLEVEIPEDVYDSLEQIINQK